MSSRRTGRALPIALAALGILSGCYYDPYTGYASPSPPPGYGYPPPGAPGPQAQGGPPPAADMGGAYAPGADMGGAYGPGPQAEGGPPPGEAMPGAGPPGAYAPEGPAAQGRLVTRAEFIRRAVRQATQAGRDPQRAAAWANRVFDQIDVNHTGAVSQEQIREWRAARRRPPYQAPPYQGQPYQGQPYQAPPAQPS